MANADSIRNETFFSLNAKYQVATDNTPSRLLEDASCLLDLAIHIIREQIEDEETPKLWAAQYLAEQAKAALNASHNRLAHGISAAAHLILTQRTTWTQINYTPQADARLERALQEFELGARDPTEAALRRRSYEKADRIAGVLAVWANPASPLVTVDHVDWAIALVNASNAAMWRFLNKHMHEGTVQSNAAKVLEWCQRILSKEVLPDRGLESEAISAGAVPRSLVLKRSKLSAKELAEATQHLTVQGDLEAATFKPSEGRECSVLRVL